MKKLKLLFPLLLFFALVLGTGCKSLPTSNAVDSLDLLDSESGFYIAMPVQADQGLIKRLLQNNVQNISEKDINMICGHISKVYCGLNRTKKNTEIQVAIDSNLPVNLVSKALSKKAGWTKKSYTSSTQNVFDVFMNDGLELSIPSGNNICIGRNLPNMLNTYAELSKEPLDVKVLEDKVHKFLKGAKDEIRFYANKPQSFMTILTGTNLNFQLESVWGVFQQDPECETQYLLDLDFVFKNAKFLKTGKSLLTLAFGLTATESSTNANELLISGIKISKEQLYKLLVI